MCDSDLFVSSDDNCDEDSCYDICETVKPVKRTSLLTSSKYYTIIQRLQHLKDDADNDSGFKRLDDYTAVQLRQAWEQGQNDLVCTHASEWERLLC